MLRAYLLWDHRGFRGCKCKSKEVKVGRVLDEPSMNICVQKGRSVNKGHMV